MIFKNKRINAAKANIPFELTLDEYIQLMNEANIKVNDIGHRGYHLSRYNDTGPYKIGNCRFIPYTKNLSEKKISDKIRETARHIIKKNSNLSKENALKALEKARQTRKNTALKKRKLYEETAHKSFLGAKNSQYNTCWINDGNVNKKIKKDELEYWLSNNYKKGRINCTFINKADIAQG